MKTHKEIVMHKLNAKRFKKNNLYSTKKISSILGMTNNNMLRNGNLNSSLKNSPEWRHESGRMWTYIGPEIKNTMASTLTKKQLIKTKPNRREISLFWGLISIK